MLLKNHIYKVNEIDILRQGTRVRMQDFLNVIVGNDKDSLVFFPARDQNFSSMLRFNEMEKKIPRKTKHIESNFRNKADILS